MKYKDAEAEELWETGLSNNDDPYGAEIYRYARAWAEQMEAEMGDVFDGAIAKSAARSADTEGITGFMYGAAVSTLSHTWVMGEELRQWHNLDTQIGTEGEKANESGGTLNPALVSFGADG